MSAASTAAWGEFIIDTTKAADERDYELDGSRDEYVATVQAAQHEHEQRSNAAWTKYREFVAVRLDLYNATIDEELARRFDDEPAQS